MGFHGNLIGFNGILWDFMELYEIVCEISWDFNGI